MSDLTALYKDMAVRVNRCSSVKKVYLKTKDTKVYLDKNVIRPTYSFDSDVYKFDSTLITFDMI
jgi:NACalpha-BTF3-like transcription factor